MNKYDQVHTLIAFAREASRQVVAVKRSGNGDPKYWARVRKHYMETARKMAG